MLTIAETATQSLQTDKILNDTLDKSLEILNFDVGSVRVLDHEAKNTLFRIDRGFHHPANYTPRNQHRIEQLMIKAKEPHISPDIRQDPIHKSQSMEREGVISAAHAPIMSKKRVFGSLTVGSRRFHKFSKIEVDLLKAFGFQLGMALENAQLYDEMRQGKLYIENLVENAGEAIITTDAQDNILTWNHAAEVIFGYAKGEAVGKSLTILVPPGHPNELEDLRAKVQLTGPTRNLEVRRIRKDGVMINVALAVSPIKEEEDKVNGFLHMARDITEKTRYERRLKELDQMKSEFVSNVSHELRTPLTAIKGSADNMLDGITGPLSERQTRYLGRIKSNADRLGRLITDLLDLSKIEAGKIDLKPARLPVNLLVMEAADVLRAVAAEKLIGLEVARADEPVHVWADRDKVLQILMNLIGNALKFTPPHGKVIIAVDNAGAEWIKLSVADTGPGIPPQEAAKIFDKFYQMEQSNRQKTQGTGLGLAISKALVEMHGGKIWIETGIDSGSVFSFTLPARRPLEI
ncbi:MAG: PAS domain S-box protein [Deltaproteobacteria bacterium]|nr:PAS domain S-box protein [Deltaproteobacteria bacterium]